MSKSHSRCSKYFYPASRRYICHPASRIPHPAKPNSLLTHHGFKRHYKVTGQTSRHNTRRIKTVQNKEKISVGKVVLVIVACRLIICWSWRPRQIIDLWGTDKSRYFAISNGNRMGHFRSLVPLFQSKSRCKTIFMKMTWFCMKMKLHAELIFMWQVSHLDSFWNRGRRGLENGILSGVHFGL